MIKKTYSAPIATVIVITPFRIMAGSYIEQGKTDGEGEGQFDASAKGTSLFSDPKEEDDNTLW